SAVMILDPRDVVTGHNDSTLSVWNLPGAQLLGKRIQTTEIMLRCPELAVRLETIRQPGAEPVSFQCRLRLDSEERTLFLTLRQIRSEGGERTGTILYTEDLTVQERLQTTVEQLEATGEELQSANEELETTNEELQSTNEELETTNEELQSTVEELETTNEELQSTNEELETMNEELQSTNEELQTLNDELRQRGEDLNTSNAFLESVLSSLRGGVAVVDEELRVLAWNDQAAELWGLRGDEVDGKHLLNLDIGLPLDRVRPLLRKCLGGDAKNQVITVDAVNRRGKSIQCQVTCTPLVGSHDGVRGAILLMEEPNGQ
ncbi:MAG TPA: PAS domain-containing protein, partial [Gemmatimonadales bacterium]|nr:PAS domain-containing protein [Gemmatimonadales bacterium]